MFETYADPGRHKLQPSPMYVNSTTNLRPRRHLREYCCAHRSETSHVHGGGSVSGDYEKIKYLEDKLVKSKGVKQL